MDIPAVWLSSYLSREGHSKDMASEGLKKKNSKMQTAHGE